MRIIIRESALDSLMTQYMETWVENKYVARHTDFILIQEKAEYDDEFWRDLMEYDFTDGRLWIKNDFKKLMSDLFGKSVLDIIPFLTKWFETKFGVKVEYTE